MRERFEMQLGELNNNLISMGALCESAIASAIKALLTDDKSLISKVKELEREIDNKERFIESLCMKLLLQQQPVAKDLRTVSSALKMITDMERIGDQAFDIAEMVPFCTLQNDACHDSIALMAKEAIEMVINSVDSFVNKDMEMAKKVIDNDDVVDDLFVKIKNDIIKLISENAENGENAVDVVMIAKYLERIGDHATNIAEWVVFSLTGTHD